MKALIYSLLISGFAFGQAPLENTIKNKLEVLGGTPESGTTVTTTFEFIANEDVIFPRAHDKLRGRRSFFLKKGEKITFVKQEYHAYSNKSDSEMKTEMSQDDFTITETEGGFIVRFKNTKSVAWDSYLSKGKTYEVEYKEKWDQNKQLAAP